MPRTLKACRRERALHETTFVTLVHLVNFKYQTKLWMKTTKLQIIINFIVWFVQ